MYQEIQQEKIKSQWVRLILISQDSRIVAIKYQEQWLLYNLIEKKSRILLQTRSGPGMFSPNSKYFITVGVNFNEQHESVNLIQVQPEMINPISLFELEGQVRGFDINGNSDRLILNFINGSLLILNILTKEKVLQLVQTNKYDSIQFSGMRIIGTQQHCISFFDQIRLKKLKNFVISGQLSEYQKYTHYCDIKQVTPSLILFRQSRGMEKFCFRIINNQKGKMLRIFRDCLRFENLNINVSPDHTQIIRLRKLENIEIEVVEIHSGNSYHFFNDLDTKQPICFSSDWNLIIQSTKQGYAKVYRKLVPQ